MCVYMRVKFLRLVSTVISSSYFLLKLLMLIWPPSASSVCQIAIKSAFCICFFILAISWAEGSRSRSLILFPLTGSPLS